MKRLLIPIVLALCVISARAQSPKIEGPWYGTISPPGAQFDVVVSFQKTGDSWTGMLMMENGRGMALKDITIGNNAISFALDNGQVVFKGAISADPPGIAGELTQQGQHFPFKLTRNPTPSLQGAGAAIDPNELIQMMTSVSGSLSERPFAPPLTYPAIEYGIRPSHDPVARLIEDVNAGRVQIPFDREHGYLPALLKALNIPVESQMAVLSRTSVQAPLINPSNPRALYFNDSVIVGSVHGGFIEIAAQDPEQGANFYMLPQQPGDKPFFIKRDECLGCHLSRNSLDIPGMLARSVYPARDGSPINPLGSHLMDHRTPFAERWGGWYVTGNLGSMHHLGNAVYSGAEKPETAATLKFDAAHYLTPYSDIVALSVFEHQMHMMNMLTRVGWDFRIASSLEAATGKRNPTIDSQLRDAVNEFVDYLLFIDEPAFPNKIGGTSGFAEKFAAQGPADAKGRSLRQFDLDRRLMKYPCSYMVYSPAFDALPAEAKKSIYARMKQILSGNEKDSKYAALSPEDHQAVTEILRDTKKEFNRF